MGYCVSKSRQSWRVVFEQWVDGKKSRRHIKRPEYANLGLANCSSIEQARDAVKHLNAKARLLQLERKRNALAARRDQENLVECAHLPAQ